jgi:hypothetical protein
MIGRNFLSRQNAITLIATLGGAALVILLSNPELAWQIRAALFGSVALAVLFLTAREINLRLHLYLALLTLAFGWRTAQVGGVILDAQQAVAWLLLFHLVMYRTVVQTTRLHIRGLWLAPMTMLISALGLVTGWNHDRSLAAMLSEIGPLILSVPVIVGLRTLVRNRDDYRAVVGVLMLVILLIAIPGIFGYILPTSGSTYYRADQGFVRANFPLWGGSVAGYVLAMLSLLVMPFAVISERSRFWKSLSSLAAGVGLLAVFLSGQRGAWIALAAGIVAFAFIVRRWRIQVLVTLLGIWLLLPAAVQNSLVSVIDVNQQTAYNSSATKRFARAESTLGLIAQSPVIGSGVGASGWAHTDVLQIAANFGIPAAILLLVGWYWPLHAVMHTLNRELARSGSAHDVVLIRGGLVAAAVASFILLATEAMIVISALALPVWIVIGLLWAESGIIQSERGTEPPLAIQQGQY